MKIFEAFAATVLSVALATPANAFLFHGAATLSHTPTRTVAGLIFQDDFTTLSAWNVGSNWSADTTLPTYVAYPTPLILVPIGAIGSADGSGPREGTPYIDNSGNWTIFYDAGDGNCSGPASIWQIQTATSSNRGLTIAKNGPIGLALGGYNALSVGTGIMFSGSTGYLQVQGAGSLSGCQVPAFTYQNNVYSFTNPLSTYTLVNSNTPPLGAPGDFDQSEVVGGDEELVSGTYNLYYSASQTGTTFSVGHATASNIGGTYTKDGLGNFIASAVSANPENPKKWFDATLNKNVICANAINASAIGNDCYYSNSSTSFQGSDVYRYRIQFKQSYIDSGGTFNAVGLINRFKDMGNNTIMNAGFVPFVFDSGAPTSFNGGGNAGFHLGRSIYQGELEPSLGAAAFTGSSATDITHAMVNSDFETEFGYEIPPSVSSGTACFTFRRSSTSTSTNGYEACVIVNGSPNNVTINKLTAGTPSLLGGSTNASFLADTDARNRVINRIRVSAQGSTLAIYINGDTTPSVSVTDSTYGSGTSVGFQGSQPVRFNHFSMRTGNSVSVTGAGAGTTVTLRGYGGVVMASTTADGGGNATLTNVHFPAWSIDVNNVDKATGGVWGGDQWSF